MPRSSLAPMLRFQLRINTNRHKRGASLQESMADGGDGRGHGGGGHDHGDGHICNCAQEHKDSLEGVDERFSPCFILSCQCTRAKPDSV